MTRTRALLFVVFAFIATLAFGQTYVRPSKGAPVPAFAQYADAGIAIAAAVGPMPATDTGTQYEWSAFETVRIRVVGRAGTGYWGQDCSLQVLQYDLQGVATVLRMQLQRTSVASGTTWSLVAYDAARPMSGTSYAWGVGSGFTRMSSANATMNLSPKFLGCTVDISLVPIPFATVMELRDPDGGIINTPTGPPFQCPHIYQNSYLMDGGIIVMGVAPSRGERYYTIVCNSKDNTSGNLRCRADDAGVVSTTAGSIGDVLGVGDCINYSNSVANPIHCIGGGIYATTFECSP